MWSHHPHRRRLATIPPRGTPADDLIPGDVLALADRYILCHPDDGRLMPLSIASVSISPGPGDTVLHTVAWTLWKRWKLVKGQWIEQ